MYKIIPILSLELRYALMRCLNPTKEKRDSVVGTYIGLKLHLLKSIRREAAKKCQKHGISRE